MPRSVVVTNQAAAFDRALYAMTNLGLTPQSASRDSGLIITEWTSRAAGCGEMYSCPKDHFQIRYTVMVTKTRGTVSIQSRGNEQDVNIGLAALGGVGLMAGKNPGLIEKGYKMLPSHPVTPEAQKNQEALVQALR
jgi:hypothetical protein